MPARFVRTDLGPSIGVAPRGGDREVRRARTIGHRDAAGQIRHSDAVDGFAREGIRGGARSHLVIRGEEVLACEHPAGVNVARAVRA